MGHAARVSNDCDHEGIFAAFGKRSETSKDRAIHDAYYDIHADQLLAQMLDSAGDSTWEKVLVAGRLGDFTGAAGDAALRRAFAVSGRGTTDLRGACVSALARRLGQDAMPDLLAALADSNSAVKDSAVFALSRLDDDRAWEQVFAYLRVAVRRRKRKADARAAAGLGPQRRDRRLTPLTSVIARALAYLAQHLSEPERRMRLVDFIRKHWADIDEDDWFAQLWPEAAPGGLAAEDVAAPQPGPLHAWSHLMSASNPPQP